jgi:hypothetical protein
MERIIRSEGQNMCGSIFELFMKTFLFQAWNRGRGP